MHGNSYYIHSLSLCVTLRHENSAICLAGWAVAEVVEEGETRKKEREKIDSNKREKMFTHFSREGCLWLFADPLARLQWQSKVPSSIPNRVKKNT